MMKFDFNEWKALAESDPEAFEQKRKEVLEQCIAAVPKERQQRLRGLQWRVDAERTKHKNSLMSCRKVFSMMWDSVYAERGLLQALNFNLPVQSEQVADVVSLATKRKHQATPVEKVTER